MVCGAVEAIVVVGGIGDSVGVVDVETAAAVGIDIADSELGSDFGGSEESVIEVEGGAGTLLVVSGLLSLSLPGEGLVSPPGVGLVVDEGSSGLMSLLLGIACSLG